MDLIHIMYHLCAGDLLDLIEKARIDNRYCLQREQSRRHRNKYKVKGELCFKKL